MKKKKQGRYTKRKIISVVRLNEEQSAERKRKRSMDIWPDVGRYNVLEALGVVEFSQDPLVVSFFKDHRSAQVRQAANKRLQKIRMQLNEKTNNNYTSCVEPDTPGLDLHVNPGI